MLRTGAAVRIWQSQYSKTTKRREHPPLHGWKGCEAPNILFYLVVSKVQHPAGINVFLKTWIPVSPISENISSFEYMLNTLLYNSSKAVRSLRPFESLYNSSKAIRSLRPFDGPEVLAGLRRVRIWLQSFLPVSLKPVAYERLKSFVKTEFSPLIQSLSSEVGVFTAINYFTRFFSSFELIKKIKLVGIVILRCL